MFGRDLTVSPDLTDVCPKLTELAVKKIAALAVEHQPVAILAPIRGGLVPGVMLSHLMGIPLFALNFSLRDHKVIEDIPRSLLDYIARSDNKCLLLVDDIVDGGTTFTHLTRILNEEIPDVHLVTSALLVNTEQPNKVDFPGFIFKRSENSTFFNFYWEL